MAAVRGGRLFGPRRLRGRVTVTALVFGLAAASGAVTGSGGAVANAAVSSGTQWFDKCDERHAHRHAARAGCLGCLRRLPARVLMTGSELN